MEYLEVILLLVPLVPIAIGLYFTFHKPHKPNTIEYPVIEFEQFKAFYATAPDRWSWRTISEKCPEHSIDWYDPDRLLIQYDIVHTTSYNYGYYNSYTKKKSFAIYREEAKKFVKFFVNEANRAQEKINNEQLIECLSYWRQDAARAEERAKKELEQAKENYLKISSNLKYENYYIHE